MSAPFDPDQHPLLCAIINNVNIGLVVLDRKAKVTVWNKFMHSYSGIAADEIIGQELFPFFPEIPKQWLLQKLHNVFILKNYSFTTWEQRPYLFKFHHTRPVTTRLDNMRQNCTFFPLKDHNGRTDYVCIAVFDVTHTSVFQETLLQSIHNLEESNHRDALTHAFNRRYLEDVLVRETSRSQRHDTPLSFVMIDLDHFKRINDQYGHLAGDDVLIAGAARLQSILRASDIFARYGGEEFAVILPNTELDGAQQLAERLRQGLEELEIDHEGKTLHITASFGVSQYCASDMNNHELIDQADQALYQAKEQGRNRVCCHAFKPFTAKLAQAGEEIQQEHPLHHLKLVHSAKTLEPSKTVEKVVNQLGPQGLPEDLDFPDEFDLPDNLFGSDELDAPQVESVICLAESEVSEEVNDIEANPKSTTVELSGPKEPAKHKKQSEKTQSLVTYVTIGYK